MLIPSIFAENLFDDWFDFPSFRNMDRQLYGRHFAREVKTDDVAEEVKIVWDTNCHILTEF